MKQDVLIKLTNLSVEEVLEREVTGFGTGSHATIPVKHIGKRVTILILKPKGGKQ